MTGDPLYWCLLGIVGFTTAAYYQLDTAYRRSDAAAPRPGLAFYMVAGSAASAFGAMVVGPLLQLAWQLVVRPDMEIIWPAPVSLDFKFLLGGMWVGITGLAIPVLWISRRRSERDRQPNQFGT